MMKYFLVSYAHTKGFGRRLFGTSGPIDENLIFRWEKLCSEQVGQASIIAISKIDGPITGEKTCE